MTANALLFSLLAAAPSPAQTRTPRELSDFSLEDLMNLQVTSVSKKEQKLSEAGAAVYVITQEDIRRSGATNIPDVLRMAPGVDVQQIDANAWAISIRGFTDRYANKVLVLIDGRSVYCPVFSDVAWDTQNLPLADIERIEVIRGPGGTVWGANAVNGVINITTKNAKSTQGGLLTAGGGSATRGDSLVRYGGVIGRKGAYRVYGRYFNIGNSAQISGGEAADSWHASQGGFRSDWDLSGQDTLTVQGDLQRTGGGQTITTLISSALPLQRTMNDPVGSTTGNILGRWNHTLAGGSEMSLQVYEDYYHRREEGVIYSQNTFDLSFQHHVALGSRHDVVWGLGIRNARTDFTPGYSVRLVPPQRTDRLLSAFVQDEIRLTNSLRLNVGTKLEHNDYTGFEYEPSAQLVWTPTRQQAIWVSAARAIRQPCRTDTAVRFDEAIVRVPGAPFGVITAFGNPNLKAEDLRDLEAGYRAQLAKPLSLDIAAFWGRYEDLQTFTSQTPYFVAAPGVPHLVIPAVLQNLGRARTFGAELFVNWNAARRWRMSVGSSTARIHNLDGGSLQGRGTAPQYQFQLRSFFSLPHNLEWDQTLAYTGHRTTANIPAYARLDTRFGWRMAESVELSVSGQNLLRPRHAEFPDEYGLHHTEIERSVFGTIAWRF